jgi:hypothetical protein
MTGVDLVALSVFAALFLLVTVLGFLAAHWRRGDLALLNEWGLAGRRFGTIVTWFLLGGDLYTGVAELRLGLSVAARRGDDPWLRRAVGPDRQCRSGYCGHAGAQRPRSGLWSRRDPRRGLHRDDGPRATASPRRVAQGGLSRTPSDNDACAIAS